MINTAVTVKKISKVLCHCENDLNSWFPLLHILLNSSLDKALLFNYLQLAKLKMYVPLIHDFLPCRFILNSFSSLEQDWV